MKKENKTKLDITNVLIQPTNQPNIFIIMSKGPLSTFHIHPFLKSTQTLINFLKKFLMNRELKYQIHQYFFIPNESLSLFLIPNQFLF